MGCSFDGEERKRVFISSFNIIVITVIIMPVIRDTQRVWLRDLAIPVRRYNQLSYEATDVGNVSFVGSNHPVRNEFEVMYEVSYDLRSNERSFMQLRI